MDPEGFLIGELNGSGRDHLLYQVWRELRLPGVLHRMKDVRGRSYGMRMWDAAIAHAGSLVIGLDGVVAQQENYQKSGLSLAYPNA